MAGKSNYLTKEGFANVEAELKHLITSRRQEIAGRIQRAKEVGGTVDNAEYDESKNEQAFVEGRILDLEKMIREVVIIDERVSKGGLVQLGARVTVMNDGGVKENYVIVGKAETDPSRGRISNESPVGKALLGKKVGDQVQINTPAGKVVFTVSGIS